MIIIALTSVVRLGALDVAVLVLMVQCRGWIASMIVIMVVNTDRIDSVSLKALVSRAPARVPARSTAGRAIVFFPNLSLRLLGFLHGEV